MTNFISFKRFVTFGLGLGMFMSASSGFAQTITNGTWLASPGTGVTTVQVHNAPVNLTGTSKLTAQGGIWTTTSEVQGNQTVYGTTTANGGIVMNGSQITGLKAGVAGTDAANMNNLNAVSTQVNNRIGAAESRLTTVENATANNTNSIGILNGKTQFVNSFTQQNGTTVTAITSNATAFSGNTFTSGLTQAQGGLVVSGQTPSGNAMVVNGNTYIGGNTTVNGGLNVNGRVGGVQAGTANNDAVNVGQLNTSVSAAVGTAVGSGSQDVDSDLGIYVGTVSGGNATDLAASALKAGADYTDGQIFAVEQKLGVTDGRVATTGSRSNWKAATSVNGRSIQRDATTGEVTGASLADFATVQANDALAEGKNYTDAQIGAETQARIDGDANTLNQANGYTDARVGAETQTRINEVKRVDGRIDATNTRVTNEVTRLDGRIDTETQARIDGDANTLNAANTYTDSKIVAQSGADRAYTDKAVASERDRAMAAEAALSKETKQVGAMAMAAAGVAGATPVGDKKTAVSAAVGGYSGQTAIAVGVTHLIKENTRVFGAFSKVSGGKTGVTVGASFSF